eukprot:5153886-Pleurochrysis_carterae.AAC.2
MQSSNILLQSQCKGRVGACSENRGHKQPPCVTHVEWFVWAAALCTEAQDGSLEAKTGHP